MALVLRRTLLVIVTGFLVVPSLAFGAGVQPLFDLSSPTGGPFPSDRFTLADPSQITGVLVNLPKPDCATRPSDCADIDVINTLDGSTSSHGLRSRSPAPSIPRRPRAAPSSS